MGAVTYPDERVSQIIRVNFIPVQIDITEHPEFTDRFAAHWTPTIIFLDQEGREHRRSVGFKPPEDFAAELEMGLAQITFNRGQYEDAVRRYERIVEEYPESEAAPESLYMVGVSRYRATKDPKYLNQYWDEVMERYPGSRWAKAGDV